MLLILIIVVEVTYTAVKYCTESDVVTVGYLFRSCYLNHGKKFNFIFYIICFLILQKMSVIFLIASYLLYVTFV